MKKKRKEPKIKKIKFEQIKDAQDDLIKALVFLIRLGEESDLETKQRSTRVKPAVKEKKGRRHRSKK